MFLILFGYFFEKVLRVNDKGYLYIGYKYLFVWEKIKEYCNVLRKGENFNEKLYVNYFYILYILFFYLIFIRYNNLFFYDVFLGKISDLTNFFDWFLWFLLWFFGFI